MNLLKEIEKVHNNIQAKNYEIAIEKCNKLIKKFPNNSYLYNLGGIALQQFKNIKLSVNYFQKAIDIDPKNIPAKNNLANSLKVLGKLDIAEKLYKEIISINPKYTKALNNYANLKQQFNDYHSAISLYEKALKIEENNTNILLSLASSYQGIGKFKEALKTINKLIDQNVEAMSAHKLKSSIINYNEDEGHLSQMLNLSKNNHLSTSQKIDLFFAIGKAYEDRKDFDNSFKFLEKANYLKKKSLDFKISDQKRLFKNIKETFKDINFSENINHNSDKKIIFICGMPRSGTTLVEQIIASHKDVTGAGELIYLQKSIENNFMKDNNLVKKILEEDIFSERSKISDDYFSLLNLHNFKTKFVSDKAPQNFRWLGFIKIFFPNSKIIHCTRNPKDTCLSLYKNSFASSDMNWCYAQEDIAEYYNLYKDLMNFWQKKISSDIHEVSYESLIKSKDHEINNLLKFCDLDIDEACFNHHKSFKTPIKTVSVTQARRPVYSSSINKNEFYENNLKVMFSLLN